jgi:hypothetical protein
MVAFAAVFTGDTVLATLTAPFLCKLYRGDFGGDAAIVRFVSAHMERSDQAWIDARAGRVALRFGPYDWSIVTHEPRSTR